MRHLSVLVMMVYSFSLLASDVAEKNSIPQGLQALAYIFSEGAEVNYENESYVKKGETFVIAVFEDFWVYVPEIEYQLEQGKIRIKMDDKNIKLLETPSLVHVRPYGCETMMTLKGRSSARGIDTSCACVHLNSGEHLLYLRESK